jgi:hypothetical protein
MQSLSNFVAGELTEAADGAVGDVFEAAAGQILGRAPDSGPADLNRAV